MTDVPLIRNISCGLDHSVLITDTGEIFSTGQNEDGQLGLGDNTNRFEFNKVEYPFEAENINVEDVECGMFHTYFSGSKIYTNEGKEIYVTGCNKQGSLGLGDFANRNVPVKLTGVAKQKPGITWKMECNAHSNSSYLIQTKEKNWIQRFWDSLFLGV